MVKSNGLVVVGGTGGRGWVGRGLEAAEGFHDVLLEEVEGQLGVAPPLLRRLFHEAGAEEEEQGQDQKRAVVDVLVILGDQYATHLPLLLSHPLLGRPDLDQPLQRQRVVLRGPVAVVDGGNFPVHVRVRAVELLELRVGLEGLVELARLPEQLPWG